MNKQSDLSQLLAYAGKRKILTILSWVLAAISAFVALVPLLYIWKIIDQVLKVAPNFNEAANITHYGWMAVLFATLSVLVYIAALMCSHLAAFRCASNLRITLMKHITTLPLGFLDGFGSGKMRKIVNETSSISEGYLAHQLPDKYVAMATPIGLLGLLFYFDWKLGLLSLIPVILGFVIMATMIGPNMQKSMGQYQNALEDMSNEAVEYVRGIPVVKTFGQTVFSFKRFKASIDNYFKFAITYTKQCRGRMIAYGTAINSVFAFLIAAALFFTKDSISTEFVSNLIFYIIITPIISLTLTKIMYQSENKMIVADASKRINRVFDMKPLIENRGSKKITGSNVVLKNITFAYAEGTEVIHNVSLEIPAGRTIALVGSSGSGKTTLASLISRFFDVNSGQILIGGVDIREIPQKELMNIVSFVFQDSRLLKQSILDNVRLSKPNASREEVMNALKAAQCTDIIKKLPHGIDTIIGTKGVYLSGGEQQRISIARAILKNAPIIILDEATAFADPDNESRVQDALAKLAQGKTVIMIAHRLSTIVNVDEICVVQDGQIIEKGTHKTLLKQNGIYRSMWDNYTSSAQWKIGKVG